MIADSLTVVWKEWREWFSSEGNRRSGLWNVLIMVGISGVMFPLQSGRTWFTSWITVYSACFPMIMVMSLAADAFAGERERHTLETLLASRLPDRAILLGKIIAAVGYGWGITLAAIPVAFVVVNLSTRRGPWVFYPPDIFAAVVLLSLLAGTLIVSMGTLFSLTAATVRQAGQRMLIPFIALFALPGFLPLLLPRMPEGWLQSVISITPGQVALTLGVLLLIANAILLSIALIRFRRARLILD